MVQWEFKKNRIIATCCGEKVARINIQCDVRKRNYKSGSIALNSETTLYFNDVTRRCSIYSDDEHIKLYISEDDWDELYRSILQNMDFTEYDLDGSDSDE